MEIRTSINIDAHLKQWLSIKYEVNPYKMSLKDSFGKFLHNAFLRPLPHSGQYYKPFVKTGVDLEVVIPDYLAKQNFHNVDERVNKLINNYLRSLFWEEWNNEIYFMKKNLAHLMLKDCIQIMMHEKQITTDMLSVCTIRQQYYRYTNRQIKAS